MRLPESPGCPAEHQRAGGLSVLLACGSSAVLFLTALPASAYSTLSADAWSNLTRKAQTALEHGDFRQAEQFYRQALEASKSFDAGDQRLGDTLEDLGTTLTNLKDYRQAEKAYQLCLKHRKQYLGAGSERVAVVLQRMSDLYMFENLFGNAVKCLEQEVAILDRVYGPTHRYLSLPLNKLGKALDRDHRYSDAEEAAAQSIKIRQTYIGADNPYLSGDVALLARIKSEQGKFPEALSLNQKAVALADSGFGSENSFLLEPLLGLHQLYLRDKKTAEARAVLERALKISEQQGASGTTTTIEIMMKLTPLYYAEKKYDLARSTNKKVMKLATGRPDFPPARLQQYTLGLGMQLFNSLENTDLAELISSGLAMSPRALDEEVVGYWGVLGIAQMKSNQLVKAEQSLRRMLALSDKLPGKEECLRGTANVSLGFALEVEGKTSEAEQHYKRALELSLRYPNQQYAKQTFLTYAAYLKKTGRVEEAKRLEDLASKH